MSDALNTVSPLAHLMREDDRRANTGPDDEDYTYYGPLLRGAGSLSSAAGELPVQPSDAPAQARVAELEKLVMAYRVLLTGSLIVCAHAKKVDPDKYAHNYFTELMYLAFNGGAFADEGVDGETINIVCDHLHLPRFELEEESRG